MQLIDPNLRYIWQLLTPKGRRLIVYTFLCVLAAEAIAVTVPYGLGKLTAGIGTGDQALVWFGISLFVGSEFLAHFANWGLFRVRERLFQQTFWCLPRGILGQYLEKPISWMIRNEDHIDGGGVESMRDKLTTTMDQNLFVIIPNICNISFGLVVCFVVDVWIGCGVLLFIATYQYWSRRFNATMLTIQAPVDKEFRRWFRWVRERAETAILAKAYGTENRILRELEAMVQPALQQDDYIYRIRYANSFTLRRSFSTLVVMGIGIWLALQSEAGAVGADEVVWLFLVLQQMVSRLRDISDSERVIARERPRLTTYREALTQESPIRYDEGLPFNAAQVGFQLSNASLTLGDEEEPAPILRDITLDIQAGERIGIVGLSGSGKTKLVQLLLRAYEPTSGGLLVNGEPLATYSPESYLRRVGYIPQEFEAYEGTIRDNVLVGIGNLSPETKLSDDEIWSILAQAGIEANILPNGLDTNVGFRGLKLSGGQRQRLSIAIALAKKPALMIGDEMTAHLDSMSERTVINHIYESLPRSTTVMMIAHRLSTLDSCDRFIFVRKLPDCTAGTTQVSIHESMSSLYDDDSLFRAMAKAQNFVPSA